MLEVYQERDPEMVKYEEEVATQASSIDEESKMMSKS